MESEVKVGKSDLAVTKKEELPEEEGPLEETRQLPLAEEPRQDQQLQERKRTQQAGFEERSQEPRW